MKKLSVALYCGVAVGLAGQALAQGQRQAVPAGPSATNDPAIVVNGRRLPAAEAPRSATCEVLVRDGYVAELMNLTGGDMPMRLPTRMPRNPDYSAAPLTPVGSALPDLAKVRFGVTDRPTRSNSNPVQMFEQQANIPQTESRPDLPAPGEFTLTQAIDACRAAYARGGPQLVARSPSGDAGTSPLADMDLRYNAARSSIVGADRTLPLAFALFDQNRFSESFDWFQKAARKLQMGEGGDEAALFVGKLYLQGLGERSDPAKGVEWLKKVAGAPFNPSKQTAVWDAARPELNTAMGEASVILGNIYRTGFRDIPKDPEQSRKYFSRALETGHIPAAKTLGDIYFEGLGTPRDVKKAESYYRTAAKMGLPSAEVALAEILYFGEDGVKQDRKKALAWYQAAAKLEHPAALYALGRAYDLGEGVKADPKLAMGFYKSAALQGHSGALAAMGTYFYEGKLLPRDPATARKWFEQAARSGDPDGTFNLAAMTARGEGGPRDVVQAWALMKRASALGSETAPAALASLERNMTPAEKQAAAGMATPR